MAQLTHGRLTATLRVVKRGDRPIRWGRTITFTQSILLSSLIATRREGGVEIFPLARPFALSWGRSEWYNWRPLTAVTKSMAFAVKSTVRSSRDSKHPVD